MLIIALVSFVIALLLGLNGARTSPDYEYLAVKRDYTETNLEGTLKGLKVSFWVTALLALGTTLPLRVFHLTVMPLSTMAVVIILLNAILYIIDLVGLSQTIGLGEKDKLKLFTYYRTRAYEYREDQDNNKLLRIVDIIARLLVRVYFIIEILLVIL